MISVLVPCLNEAPFIEDCLRSLLSEPAPEAQMEVLVLDGGSTDGTIDIVRRLCAESRVVRLIHNEGRTASAAMNLGLAASQGDIIVRIDAHARYPKGYVRRLTEALDDYGADLVGGVWDTQPREPTALGIAQARVLQHRLGVGNAHHRLGVTAVREVDTVPFGCWRRTTLDAVGGFAAELTRSQDFELTRRLRSRGAKVLLLPDVVVTYYARSRYWPTFRYNISNGYWVTFPRLVYDVRFSPRHYVPTAAVALGLVLGGLASAGHPKPLLASASAYAVVAGKVTLDSRPRTGDPRALWATVPLAVGSLHLAHGLGGLHGLFTGALRRLQLRRSCRSSRSG